MADPDDIDPVAARIFARKFPSVELTRFVRLEPSAGYYAGKALHIVAFNGLEGDLLRMGLVDAECLPPKPKRVSYGRHCDVWRLKGGRLKVRRELFDSLDRSHPLYDVGAQNWPLIESPAQARSVAIEELRREALIGLKVFRGAYQWRLANCAHGQRVAAADQLRLESILDRFEHELIEATEAARLESDRRPQLALVVNRS